MSDVAPPVMHKDLSSLARQIEVVHLNRIFNKLRKHSVANEKSHKIVKALAARDHAIPCDLLNNMLHDGDILLFRQRTPLARCQRCLVHSTYNHVAIVYREKDSLEARVLEADMLEGVHSFKIDTWLKVKNRAWCESNFDRLVVRRLTPRYKPFYADCFE